MIVYILGYSQDSTRSLSEDQLRKLDKALTYLSECNEIKKEQEYALGLYKEAIHKFKTKEILWQQKEHQYQEGARLNLESMKISDAEIKNLKRKNRHLKFTIAGIGLAATGAAVGIVYLAFH